MGDILLDLIRRYSSRKFLVAIAAFTIVLLDGLGAAEFTAEVLAISTTALIAYIGVEGGRDIMEKRKK